MLITPEYREMNAKLHERADYGISGEKWAPLVKEILRQDSYSSILDYGCGKRTLEKALGFPIQNYDPCIPGLERKDPADLVVCTDVLEHIEPECIDAVLDDLRAHTRKTAFLVIATKPANKTLPDGRNAHILQRPYQWWLPKLWERWEMHAFQDFGYSFLVTLQL